MIGSAMFVLTTSYVAWYFEHHEINAVYPFDTTYMTPATAGEPRLSEMIFETDDGESLILWQAPAESGKPTVLYFSGNAGGLKERSDRFRQFLDQGFGVVAPAYRGSSGSTGAPNEMTLLSDARAVARASDTGTLVLYGESLGTAVAIRLAAEGIGEKLVLESPFTSIPDLILAQHPAETLDHLITQRWESHLYIGEVTQPLLVVHGDQDRLVPFAMGETIFGTAGSTDKELMKVTDKGHAGIWTDEVQAAIVAFLAGD